MGSCSKQNIDDNYTIYISSNLSDLNIEWTIECLDEWKNSTSFRYKNIVIVDKPVVIDNSIYIVNGLLGYYQNRKIGGVTHTEKIENRSIITVDHKTMDYFDKVKYKKIVLHELGHAFGIAHLDNFNQKSVMKSSLNNPLSSEKLECIDITAYCSLWNCKGECK